MKRVFAIIIICNFYSALSSQKSIAREWNEIVIESIRNDFARPTIHARNLFHSSIAMYDIWSVVSEEGKPYLLGDTIGSYVSDFPGWSLELSEEEKIEYIDEATSYAMLAIIKQRYFFAPRYDNIVELYESFMLERGYSLDNTTVRFPEDQSAAAFGNYVGIAVLTYGLSDGSNERFEYYNEFYFPVNDPMLVTQYGNIILNDPNRWQPLAFETFIDQSGNEVFGNVPGFLSPEWGEVEPFALSEDDLTILEDDRSNKYYLYHDPGPPPYLSDSADDQGSEDYKWGFSLVSLWSSMLDPADGVMWDISPGAIGNTSFLPETFEGIKEFYDLTQGGDGSSGRTVNPITGEAYASQIVPRADYARVLAEFWADGPDSETPPGHWFSILHAVMDHPDFNRQWEGSGGEIDVLEYDVKAFFTLGGAMHDAAISTWGIKGWYDYIRPISSIRYMASKGQSTDQEADNYDPHGLPLIPGFIEVINEDDPLAISDSLIGKIKVLSWKGPDYIEDPDNDVAGVGWIPGENWWPYQRPTFVSPPFAGYTSGHSCFSRAAAEVLTMMTGDEYFPGGIGVFPANKNEFLVFEDGPSVDIELQWATYRDASDQTSLSRIWGGIHPPQDDIPGRIFGITIGIDAFNKANTYFGTVNTSTYDEPLIERQFTLFPSPISSEERLHIQSKDLTINQVKLEVYDLNAKKVRSEIIRPNMTTLDLRGLSNGTYYVHLIGDGNRQIEEIIIID